MDIDDRHLFIQESYLEFVQAKVKEFKEKYRRPPLDSDKLANGSAEFGQGKDEL